jgi:ABC-type transport system involved in cytochrome c biogenesis ATPase subunit
MAAKKKLTNKELEERINILAYNLNVTKAGIDNIGIAFSQYLKYIGHEEEFKKYLENLKNVDKLNKNGEKSAT